MLHELINKWTGKCCYDCLNYRIVIIVPPRGCSLWTTGRSPVIMESGPWFNIKMSSYQYRKSHWGDKTVIRSSYLHYGISYTGKMSSLYWIGSLTVKLGPEDCFHQHGSSLFLAWISNHTPHKVWDQSTCKFPNGAAVEVWKWVSSLIQHFTGHVVT